MIEEELRKEMVGSEDGSGSFLTSRQRHRRNFERSFFHLPSTKEVVKRLRPRTPLETQGGGAKTKTVTLSRT